MTGNGEVETAARAIRSGAIGFLQKPFVEEKLFDSVEHALSIAGDPGYRVAATKAAQQNLEGLTQRERQVLELLVTGRSNVEVAGELNCNLHTAEIYRARVMQKTGADSLWQLMRIALLAGVLIAE
jgi:two-component system response regulator FixJ